MSSMIDWDLEDDGLDAVFSESLPRFLRRRAGVPKQAWHLLLQWKSSVGTTEKRRLLATALASATEVDLTVYKKEATTYGDDAVRSFLEDVDSESWWLGDIGLMLRSDGGSTLVAPTADGSFLEFFSWGDRGPLLHEGWRSRLGELIRHA